MIIVNTIEPERLPLYDSNDTLLGYVNEYELLDIRIQICNELVEGYYLIMNNEKVHINKFGMILHHNVYPFDTIGKLEELLLLGIAKRKWIRNNENNL